MWDYRIRQSLPTSLPSLQLKPTTLNSALWKKPLGTQGSGFVYGRMPAPSQLEGSPQGVNRGACAQSAGLQSQQNVPPVQSGLCLAADGLCFTLGEPFLLPGLAYVVSEVGAMAGEHR